LAGWRSYPTRKQELRREAGTNHVRRAEGAPPPPKESREEVEEGVSDANHRRQGCRRPPRKKLGRAVLPAQPHPQKYMDGRGRGIIFKQARQGGTNKELLTRPVVKNRPAPKGGKAPVFAGLWGWLANSA